MNKIKFLKEYTYISICDIDFNVVIDFDYDNEMLLYSLKYCDNEYNVVDYLIEFSSQFDEEAINNAIKSFMLIHIWAEVDKWITLNDYKNWKVEKILNGLKLINTQTKQWAIWNIYDYSEDYEAVKEKMIKFLNKQYQ